MCMRVWVSLRICVRVNGRITFIILLFRIYKRFFLADSDVTCYPCVRVCVWIQTGFGAKAKNILALFTEYRGVSWR